MEIEIQSEPQPQDAGAFRDAKLFANYVLTPAANPPRPMHGAATLRFDSNLPRKEEAMSLESQYAEAAPATAFQWPRVPVWLVVLLAFGILYAMAAAFHSSDASRDQAKSAAADARHAAFEQKLSAIATPAAFQAKCGQASRVEHLEPPVYEAGTTRLTYPEGSGEDLRVYLSQDRAVGFETVLGGRSYLPSGAVGSQDERMLSEIGCSLD